MYCRVPPEQTAFLGSPRALDWRQAAALHDVDGLTLKLLPLYARVRGLCSIVGAARNMFPESAAMEASPLSTSRTEDWAEQFDRSLNLQRDRIREFLDAQQQRLQHVEEELDRQLQNFADELAQNRGEVHRATEEAQQRSEQLAREAGALEGFKEELRTRQAEWEQFQERVNRQQEALAQQIQQQQDQSDQRREELAQRQSEIDAAEAKLHHDQQAFDLARQEHQADLEQQAVLREQLGAIQADLDTRCEQLDARQADTQGQRRRIAREFKAQHAADLKELDRRRAELQQRDTRGQLELQQQLEAAQAQQTESSAAAKAAQQRTKQLEAELETLQDKCGKLQQTLSQRPAEGGTEGEELRRVEADRDELRTRLSETESRLAEAQQGLADAQRGGGEAADEDMQRRYEMAMEDLRDLKHQNADIQAQLARARSAQPAAESTGGALDWEAEKRRVLAALESDFDDKDSEAKAERMKIEEVVRETDRVVAERERECSELKKLLEDQSSNLGSVAVGAAALGEVLDSDAIIQEERQKLDLLQQEWRDKLRQAEIDISIERAKLAREKAEMEDKLRTIGDLDDTSRDGVDGSAASEKSVRGRWRERLGLKDANEK